jgi:hypothetical protein
MKTPRKVAGTLAEGIALVVDFDRLHADVQDLKRRDFTPIKVLKRLDALILRLEDLKTFRPRAERLGSAKQWQSVIRS